jgi:hypothetical protein
MIKQEKHLSEFNPSQIPQVVVWAQEHCNVTAKILENDLTIIITETFNGKEYLKELNVGGIIINPIKLNQ